MLFLLVLHYISLVSSQEWQFGWAKNEPHNEVTDNNEPMWMIRGEKNSGIGGKKLKKGKNWKLQEVGWSQYRKGWKRHWSDLTLARYPRKECRWMGHRCHYDSGQPEKVFSWRKTHEGQDVLPDKGGARDHPTRLRGEEEGDEDKNHLLRGNRRRSTR